MTQKRLIKVAIIFMLLMVTFTILSRVATNATIPRVTLVQPERMTITHKATSSGIVQLKQEQAVSSLPNQVVASVEVVLGQSVAQGELLYRVDETELAKQIQGKKEAIAILDLQQQQNASITSVSQIQHNVAWKQANAQYEQIVARENEIVTRLENELAVAKKNQQEYGTNPELFPNTTEEELVATVAEKQSSYDSAITNREEQIQVAKNTLELAGIPLSTDTSLEQSAIQKQQLEREVVELVSLQEAKGQIHAMIAGILTEVNIKAGSITTGTEDILLGDISAGAKIVASFPEESKKYLIKGTKVQLSQSGRVIKNGTEDYFQIQGISPNEKDSTMTDVTIIIPPSEIVVGTNLDVIIEMPDQDYDMCIPRKALNKDNYGNYFVYAIAEHNSVLGDELRIVALEVEVIDENEQYVAVAGIGEQEEIVTESTKMIEEGSRVKRQENE